MTLHRRKEDFWIRIKIMLLPTTTSVGSSPTYSPMPTSDGFGYNTETVASVLENIGQYTTLLSPLLNGEIIGKTIGQALADGFDCWGSTWTPSRAEQELPEWISVISAQFEESLNVPRESLQTSVNTFFKTFWTNSVVSFDTETLEDWLGWRYDTARDCTKRGLIALEKGVDAHLKVIVELFPGIADAINADITVYWKTITLYRGLQREGPSYTKSVPQITVKLKPMVEDNASNDLGNASPKLMGGGVVMLLLAGLAWYNRKKLF